MDGAKGLVEDLFRRESAHLVSALVRLLGPAHVSLAEDVVQDALVVAMQAWRLGPPEDPKAWLIQVAKNRAIDALRRGARLQPMASAETSDGSIDLALSPEADGENQLRLMFAICDGALSRETHATLILRLLCGLSPAEIARAFLVDVQTVDRRLHRGRARLREMRDLEDVSAPEDARARQPSVEQALYLLFNEGYHGSDHDNPLRPAMCADALRLAELLIGAVGVELRTTHALAALFCFNAARLATRLDDQGVFVRLAEQDRSRWDRALIDRGVRHLAESATGDEWSRWHLEAGIAFEHTRAPSLIETDWGKIVQYYDVLMDLAPGPVVGMNRALALAEVRGLDAGRDALAALASDRKLADYSFYWAARADIERRAGCTAEARVLYGRALAQAHSSAERAAYERMVSELEG